MIGSPLLRFLVLVFSCRDLLLSGQNVQTYFLAKRSINFARHAEQGAKVFVQSEREAERRERRRHAKREKEEKRHVERESAGRGRKREKGMQRGRVEGAGEREKKAGEKYLE
ncbi:hypothetical protein MRB53_009911 [Persea americana]|uniref:Uncharacterized protein n=1 Tax=Persea americana TaxID=3435 RepID=A0ACC2LQC7_PERAE|nr:hypothetical protein MRB53_009911 [Persea americana]